MDSWCEQWPFRHQYGVLVLPIIEWNFRFQRPQQLARQLAKSKHPVSYASISFGSDFRSTLLAPGISGLKLPGRRNACIYNELPSEDEIEKIVTALQLHIDESESYPWVCMVQLPYWAPIAERLNVLGAKSFTIAWMTMRGFPPMAS